MVNWASRCVNAGLFPELDDVEIGYGVYPPGKPAGFLFQILSETTGLTQGRVRIYFVISLKLVSMCPMACGIPWSPAIFLRNLRSTTSCLAWSSFLGAMGVNWHSPGPRSWRSWRSWHRRVENPSWTMYGPCEIIQFCRDAE